MADDALTPEQLAEALSRVGPDDELPIYWRRLVVGAGDEITRLLDRLEAAEARTVECEVCAGTGVEWRDYWSQDAEPCRHGCAVPGAVAGEPEPVRCQTCGALHRNDNDNTLCSRFDPELPASATECTVNVAPVVAGEPKGGDLGDVADKAAGHTADLTVSTPDVAGEPESRTEVTHACPPGDEGLTPCCGRTPFELPRSDRMTLDPALVTCGAGEPESTPAADELPESRYGGVTCPDPQQEGQDPYCGRCGWRLDRHAESTPAAPPDADPGELAASLAWSEMVDARRNTAGSAPAADEPYPSRPPQPAEERLTDLMAALDQSVREAKEARARRPRAADTQEAP